MGTEILHPQDCFIRQLPALSLHANPHSKPFKKKGYSSKSARSPKNSSSNSRFSVGQVTILKRKEAIESLVSDRKVLGSGLASMRVAYAGTGFSTSPSPRSVPLPMFSRREEVIDESKTRDLRRLLGLN